MIKIEAVVFDFGGVISCPAHTETLDKMVELSGLNKNDFIRRYKDCRVEYDRGCMAGADFWKEVLLMDGTDGGDLLIEKMMRLDLELWTQENLEVTSLVKKLNSVDGLKVGILSNMPSTYKATIQNKMEWIKDIDPLLYSCDLKMVKPEPEIYKACITAFDTEAAKMLFIDDTEHNAEGGRRAGLNVIRYESFPQLLQEMESTYSIPGLP